MKLYNLVLSWVLVITIVVLIKSVEASFFKFSGKKIKEKDKAPSISSSNSAPSKSHGLEMEEMSSGIASSSSSSSSSNKSSKKSKKKSSKVSNDEPPSLLQRCQKEGCLQFCQYFSDRADCITCRNTCENVLIHHEVNNISQCDINENICPGCVQAHADYEKQQAEKFEPVTKKMKCTDCVLQAEVYCEKRFKDYRNYAAFQGCSIGCQYAMNLLASQ